MRGQVTRFHGVSNIQNKSPSYYQRVPIIKVVVGCQCHKDDSALANYSVEVCPLPILNVYSFEILSKFLMRSR